jgi:hypothetical protein
MMPFSLAGRNLFRVVSLENNFSIWRIKNLIIKKGKQGCVSGKNNT